jgi:excisionase family DNA binding protein
LLLRWYSCIVVPDATTAKLLTVPECARALSITTEDYVRRACRTGAIRAERVDGRWLIPEDAVEEYLARREARRARTTRATRTPVDDLLDRSRRLTV